jgi:hypothetical protein
MTGSGLRNPANDPGFERKEKTSNVWDGIKGALLAVNWDTGEQRPRRVPARL